MTLFFRTCHNVVRREEGWKRGRKKNEKHLTSISSAEY
jgi:hypothetical protein